METTLLVVRVLLCGIFATAGIAKLFDRHGSQQAIRSFGIPKGLVVPFALLLPVAELAIALALLPVATAWWGALGALLLLLLFLAGIAYNLVQGRTPDCHCFGQLHSAPAGWPTMLRNGLLACLAGLILWQGPENPGLSLLQLGLTLSLPLIGLLVGAGVVVAIQVLQGWFLFQLLKQNGRLLLRIDALEQQAKTGLAAPGAEVPKPAAPGLPVGTIAPAFRLPGLYGETLALDALRAAGKPVLLLFSSPQCEACNTLLPEVGRWQREYHQQVVTVVISRGNREANQAKQQAYRLGQVLIQENREVSQAYQSTATPTAVLVRADGTIGSALASGAAEITALVEATVAAQKQRPNTRMPEESAIQPVQPPFEIQPVVLQPLHRTMPDITLSDLNGRQVELTKLKGRQRLLLFWNPTCGFCIRMLPALKAWEAQRSPTAPELILIATGSAAANRALGLRSTILLDPSFQLGRALAVDGSPSALLLDSEGRIASQIAVGEAEALTLANAGMVENN